MTAVTLILESQETFIKFSTWADDLFSFGVSGSMIDFIGTFLTRGTFQVKIGKCLLETTLVTAGIPEGVVILFPSFV